MELACDIFRKNITTEHINIGFIKKEVKKLQKKLITIKSLDDFLKSIKKSDYIEPISYFVTELYEILTDESSDMMIPDETREYVMELGQTLEDWDRTRRMHEDSTEIFDENAYHISSISLLIERLLQVFWALRGSVEESPALGPVVKEEIVREAIRPVAEHLSTHSEVGVDEWTTDMTPLFNAIALVKWYNEREQTLPNEISNEREQTLRNEISALVVKNVKEMAMLCVRRLYPH